MKHNIKNDDPRTSEMAKAIENCVHCGFCLPVCPTYNLLGEEMDSPRGRIYLMKNVLEDNLPAEEAQPYIDRCLGCMACVTACPSGVAYGDLLPGYRSQIEKSRQRPFIDKITRTMIRETLPYPARFRLAAQTGKIGNMVKNALPDAMATMLSLLPESLPEKQALPGTLPAKGEKRGRVALLRGCVQSVLAPEINFSVAHVLAKNGIEVVIPPEQNCCGSILLHIGEDEKSQQLARKNFGAFPDDVDAIIVTAAGCGSGIQDYELLFKGKNEASQAKQFAEKSVDFTSYLAKIGIREPQALKKPLRVVYQDACHLLHAQGVQSAPRELLKSIPNLTLVEIEEAGMCCGSAGTYNIEQPELASQLGQRKVQHILDAQPDVIVSANIGCMTQLRTHLKQAGSDIPVMYIAELLYQAYSTSREL